MSDAPIYDSAKRPPAWLEELMEVGKYRHLVEEFVRRDIVTRYKRSWLGVVWTMLNPLGTMIVMTIVFSQLFHTTAKYPIFVLTGLIFWNFFSMSTLAAPQTLLWSGPLLHRVYLPRTIFALVAVGGGIVNMLLSLIPLGIVMLILHVPPTLALLFLPVSILMVSAFTLGVGLLLSSVVAFFPDVLDMYSIFTTAWLYMSAIFYPYEIIPIQYRWWFLNLNPIYHLLLLFRDPLYYGQWPSIGHILTATAVAMSALVVGWWAFTRRADELAYRI